MERADHPLRAVIIVEDNADLAEFEAYALKDVASCEIIGDRFDRCFRPETWQGVEVAVIDLMLPHVAGEDICRYLRHEFPFIRTVICTAKPTYLILEMFAVADAVLQKPFTSDDLVKAVTGDIPR